MKDIDMDWAYDEIEKLFSFPAHIVEPLGDRAVELLSAKMDRMKKILDTFKDLNCDKNEVKLICDCVTSLSHGVPLIALTSSDFDEGDDVLARYTDPDGKVIKLYGCNRSDAMLKEVHEDGSCIYSDITRLKCIDRDTGKDLGDIGIARKLVDEYFPIKMPYMPTVEPGFVAECTVFAYDPERKDHDTFAIFNICKLKGTLNTKDGTYTSVYHGRKCFYKIEDGRYKEISGIEFYARYDEYKARTVPKPYETPRTDNEGTLL